MSQKFRKKIADSNDIKHLDQRFQEMDQKCQNKLFFGLNSQFGPKIAYFDIFGPLPEILAWLAWLARLCIDSNSYSCFKQNTMVRVRVSALMSSPAGSLQKL